MWQVDLELRSQREGLGLRAVSGPRNQHQQTLVQVQQAGLAQRSLVDLAGDLELLLQPVAVNLVRVRQAGLEL